jgi:phosphoribosylformylglycinamidine cyclo-ligase
MPTPQPTSKAAPSKRSPSSNGHSASGAAGPRGRGQTQKKASRAAKPQRLTYADAGVNLEEKDAFTEGLASMVRRTFGPRVIDNPGGFAGLFRLDFNEKIFARNYKHPVLVACCDGVGTKLKLAADLGIYNTIGIDLVAMNVNDMIVQGAEPLFFLDYIATPKVDQKMLSAIVQGICEGCVQSGCALLGGETAEMPDLYKAGDFDLAGFAVGVVDLKRAISPERVEVGDIVLGLASDGIHSNGYSLVRKIVSSAKLDLHAPFVPPAVDVAFAGKAGPKRKSAGAASKAAVQTLGQVLLTPTRIYVKPISRLLGMYTKKQVITGMAHITGSGLSGNLCRALHNKVDARIDTRAWPVLPVFRYLQEAGNVTDVEMRRVFNMGIGYTLVVKPAFAAAVAEHLTKLGEKVYQIGEIVPGTGQVIEV